MVLRKCVVYTWKKPSTYHQFVDWEAFQSHYAQHMKGCVCVCDGTSGRVGTSQADQRINA